MVRKIVLYSGGLDSFIGLWLLRRESPDWTPVYFDLNTRCAAKERRHIAEPDAHIVEGMLNLSHIERDSGFIPQRNVMLCAAAQAVYDATDIALCSVADDVYADNDALFHALITPALTKTSRDTNGIGTIVFSPLTNLSLEKEGARFSALMTKSEAVARYLLFGGDPEALRRTVSCYDPVELSCGQCKACTRRAEALLANGITS